MIDITFHPEIFQFFFFIKQLWWGISDTLWMACFKVHGFICGIYHWNLQRGSDCGYFDHPESSSGVCVGTLPLGTADGFLSAYISLHWSQSMYLFVLLCLWLYFIILRLTQDVFVYNSVILPQNNHLIPSFKISPLTKKCICKVGLSISGYKQCSQYSNSF